MGGVILIVFTLNSTTILHGQSCGTTSTASQNPNEGVGNRYTDCVDPTGPFFVRVYPHIIRETDGSDGINPALMDVHFKKMNEFFNPHNIYLIRMCEDEDFFIDDSDFFAQAHLYECELYAMYNHDDGIDIYFDDESALSPYFGKAGDVPGSSCIITRMYDDLFDVATGPVANLSGIVAHEVGHCFGLLHTHASYDAAWESLCYGTPHPGSDEENESNCEDEGDYCCDTPADPDMNHLVDPELCTFDITIEQSGQQFHPDAKNIMGYTHPYCAEHFSLCQGKTMRCAISEDLLDRFLTPIQSLEIETNTTWTTNSVPYNGEFVVSDSLIIRSGASLTISEGVTIKFAPSASLIIEQNAVLLLYGTLSSAGCNLYWQGVKVYGDADQNQVYSAGYHQGFLRGYPGAVIENALSAVELWGPTEEDAGGIIVCNGTTFRNNKSGVFFLPYENIVSGQPRPYVAHFKQCIFTIDNDFLFTSFDQHLLLAGVDGIRIAGCVFEYAKESTETSKQFGFGYGLVAVNAGFTVTSASTGGMAPGPCLPGNCTIVEQSRFIGLGTGIWTGSFGENRFFSVYQSVFDGCFTGIEVDGVSGGVMLFNKFNMGYVPDPDVLNGDQIGIKLNQGMAGFTIEQDTFISSNFNVNNSIGISAENLGEANNIIRNNYFYGLTLANEAFGKNAGEGSERFVGLRYLCNENISTVDKDFYVKNTIQYSVDNISAIQAEFEESGLTLAAGNKLSSSGNTSDGDFGNYGTLIDEYYHYSNDGDLNATYGISQIISALQNSCLEDFCAPPCISDNDLADLKEEYYDNKASFDDSISANSFMGAAQHKALMDIISKQIIQHILIDSVSFSIDSLRAWYSNVFTLSGDILLAKDLAAAGEFSSAASVLDEMSTRFTLNEQEGDDISSIQIIFDMLERQAPMELGQASLDTLIEYSDDPGHSASIARSILVLHGYRFETRYELPEEMEEFRYNPNYSTNQVDGITLFPNPNLGNVINVIVPNIEDSDIMEISFWSSNGARILTAQLSGRYNEIYLERNYTGIYAYQIMNSGVVLNSGRIVFLK